MSDPFSNVHQIHDFGDMSEHSLNGEAVSTSVHNHGVDDIARADGVHEWAIKNPMGGEDVYHGSTLFERTIPGIHGAYDVNDANMHLKSTVLPNIHHGHDVLHEGNLIDSAIPMGHGASTVMHYADPLEHLSEYTWTKLIL